MGLDPSIDAAARVAFGMVVLVLIAIAALRTRPIARWYQELDDPTTLEFCLFASSVCPGLRDLKSAGLRRAIPWFVASAVVKGLGIAVSVATERGFVALLAIAAAFLLHRGRRYHIPRAGEARETDTRPPALILRSLDDDNITVQGFALLPKRTLE